jgi:hypothetical protein
LSIKSTLDKIADRTGHESLETPSLIGIEKHLENILKLMDYDTKSKKWVIKKRKELKAKIVEFETRGVNGKSLKEAQLIADNIFKDIETEEAPRWGYLGRIYSVERGLKMKEIKKS